MNSFRPARESGNVDAPPTPLEVGQLIDDAMRPGQFFVAPDLRLTWMAARAETIPWEVFRGRLLDAAHTRESRTFLSWHIFEENAEHPATEPLLSVKFDVTGRQIHVTRGMLAHAWEAFDAGGGVIESRETIRWTRELVGSIALDDFAQHGELRDELVCQIWQAVVGTSRLPLTSVEAPLPAFVFGRLYYHNRGDAGAAPSAAWEDLLAGADAQELATLERTKLTEFVLRHIDESDLPRFVVRYPFGAAAARLWRAMFNEVSLSPYTCFVDNALAAIERLAKADDYLDFLAHLLLKLGRHLTAYDLVTFHHRGANYPDALLLDAVLKRYLAVLERSAEQFANDDSRRRRRALRQGCQLRRHYEGHLVPDAPTSPGENARVMPAGLPRVPEEQVLQTQHRRRVLFADDSLVKLLTPSARRILAASMADLLHAEECAELGMGIFIDRPLGYGKAIGEPDLTPLLAHEAYSPSIARRRFQELQRLCAELGIPCDSLDLGPGPVGLPHTAVAECPRPTAALCDVRKVASDFVIVRTLPAGLAALIERIPARLAWTPRLCVPTHADNGEIVLTFHDEDLRRTQRVRIDQSRGFERRAGIEWPRAGLVLIP